MLQDPGEGRLRALESFERFRAARDWQSPRQPGLGKHAKQSDSHPPEIQYDRVSLVLSEWRPWSRRDRRPDASPGHDGSPPGPGSPGQPLIALRPQPRPPLREQQPGNRMVLE